MGSVYHGIPEQMALDLMKQWGIEEFVETGTFRGLTAEWAARHFWRVTTIELPGEWYDESKAKLRPLANVQLLCGDSWTILPLVVSGLKGPTMFWLDAHWFGQGPKSDKGECPLLAEIAAINASSLPHVILADDARYFENPPPLPHKAEEWPTLAQVSAALINGDQRAIFIKDDVIVAVPQTSVKPLK